jgi:hypothetical protein
MGTQVTVGRRPPEVVADAARPLPSRSCGGRSDSVGRFQPSVLRGRSVNVRARPSGSAPKVELTAWRTVAVVGTP